MLNTLSRHCFELKTSKTFDRNPGILFFQILIFLTSLLCSEVESRSQNLGGLPTFAVGGGLYFDDNTTLLPLTYSWESSVKISAANFPPNALLEIHMFGPVKLPGVVPIDWKLGYATTDNLGAVHGGIDYDPAVLIPYKGFIASPSTPRPGNYSVYATTVPSKLGAARRANSIKNINVFSFLSSIQVLYIL